MPFLIYFYLTTIGNYQLVMIAVQLILNPDVRRIREGFIFRIVISLCLLFAVGIIGFIITNLFKWEFWSNTIIYLVLFVLQFLLYFLIFDVKFKDALFVATVAYTIQSLGYKITSLLFDYWLYNFLFQFFVFDAWIMNVITILISQFLISILSAIILKTRFHKNYKFSISSPKVVIMSTATVVVVNVLNTASLKYANNEIASQIIISLFCVACSCFILGVTAGFFEVNKAREETLKIEAFYQEKIKQFEQSKEAIDYINIKCHDLRKQIRKLKSSSRIITDEELEQIADAIRIYDKTIDSGNETLDLVITEKSLYAHKNQIEMTTMCDGTILNAFSKDEIVTFFSNILDNAIEAVSKIKDPLKRNISLIVKEVAGFIYIEETNYFEGEVELNETGIKTTKKNTNYHGFGTKSLAYTVKKHNGKITFETNEKKFILKALIPLKM